MYWCELSGVYRICVVLCAVVVCVVMYVLVCVVVCEVVCACVFESMCVYELLRVCVDVGVVIPLGIHLSYVVWPIHRLSQKLKLFVPSIYPPKNSS